LVDRVLKAAESAGRQIELFAVEKNPHAFIGYRLLKIVLIKVIATKSNRMAGSGRFI
jgi:hypothetical protein